MANLLAIDWDSRELRAVAGRSAGGQITVTGTATAPLDGDDAAAVLKALGACINDLAINKSKYKLLVTLGRGKAELRQLSCPPVPPNELPALVRFQALQNFSSSGDSVAVDFLPVEVSEQSISVIASGVLPAVMTQIQEIAKAVGIELKRVVLRPVAAAALYQLSVAAGKASAADGVLVDLLADDVEIAIRRDGQLVFVRSVRMPESMAGRTAQVAGEIRRSLMACSSADVPTQRRVVIWGLAATHQAELDQLHEMLDCDVQTLDPLSLVSIDRRSGSGDDAHTGRLAPLVGVLAADAAAESRDGDSELLIDFLNPRKTIEVEQDYRKWYAAAAAAGLIIVAAGYGMWSSFRAKDQQIADRQARLAELKPQVERAEQNIMRTNAVDVFLDGNVNWLEETRRLAQKIPAADQVMLNQLTGKILPQTGGGTLTVQADAVTPAVVGQMNTTLRDELHSVSGTGATEQPSAATYRWRFSQQVEVSPDAIRDHRYETLQAMMDAEAEAENEDTADEEAAAEVDAAKVDAAKADAAAKADDASAAETPADMPNDTPNEPADEPADESADDAAAQPQTDPAAETTEEQA